MFKTYNEKEDKMVWKLWVILMVELLGTFFMVFEIILPSSAGFGTNENLGGFNIFWNIVFGTYLMKAIWVTSFILLLIYICRKVSVNLNPAVTLAEAAVGNYTWPRTFAMIGVQFIGAFAAANFGLLVSYWSGNFFETEILLNGSVTEGSSLDGLNPRLIFNTSNYSISGQIIKAFGSWDGKALELNSNSNAAEMLFMIPTILIEAIFVFILITTVVYFPKAGNVNTFWKPFLIVIPLTIIVMIGLHTNNISLNPARLVAPAVVAQMAGGAKNMQFIWVFLFGQLLAVGFVMLVEHRKKTGAKLPVLIFGETNCVCAEKPTKEKPNTKTVVKTIQEKK